MTRHQDDRSSGSPRAPRSLGDEFAALSGERSPEAALARVLADWGARLQRETGQLAELLEAAPELSAAWRASHENDAVDYTIDRIGDDGAAWFAWWAYLLEHGRRPTYAIVSNLDALGGMDLAAPHHLEGLLGRVGRGELSLRLIVPAEARVGPAAELMSILHRAGVAIRVGDASGWFAVTPGRAALLPAVWGRDRDVDALMLHTPSIVAALEQLFLERWEDAGPWAGDEAASDPAIELLCLGRTDAQVADQLGISVRSVRRRVAAEMQRVGAVTRTQLGFRLAEERFPRGDRG